MLVIRPIRETDFGALMLCAEESGHGFTSLPVDETLIKGRIDHSLESFARNAQVPGMEGYLMVAEDTETGDVAGTTGIEAAIGMDNPFYSYHISKIVHHSRRLNVHNVVEVLTFGNNYTGATEICTLFLRPEFRGGLNGKLLSKCRFLMLAQFPEKFSDVVFAEMRGVSDEDGNSPFWAWLKEHFFSIDFTLADYLTGTGQKGFIADLMPKLPIYTSLLSEEARAVIGQVHEKTRPALRLLEKEGFTCRGYVDIFDAGPTVECLRQNIDSIRRSFTARVKIAEHSSAQDYLVCNSDFENFRATATKVAIDEERNEALIGRDVAEALGVEDGETVRLVSV
ncbi:arginine N-succinyltransferase [Grimontia hollisae]|uniref:Arginine N-succinyltransferase n=2 Tax=Grimontia hollisae TaxID=673 RepID=D0I3S1_GRIHO|nr:arginine N-succinyltransferase [Grimontia hollisae]AMG30387.1 arginine N-succinyltransferase [Grimontia hollisae]EEY73699.1 arginine N-succinyltransferase [Grimontia hollisae CIP 101886]MDF2185067.1 arginine N-succinyltransferase [Grimontia hollisae]STO42036.1 Arginine N-succinyltransferase subunit beta [Grimontia hollisae]STO55960.1 Arginine N-succinyltransferase subunit beta [Grimontia hollisae]